MRALEPRSPKIEGGLLCQKCRTSGRSWTPATKTLLTVSLISLSLFFPIFWHAFLSKASHDWRLELPKDSLEAQQAYRAASKQQKLALDTATFFIADIPQRYIIGVNGRGNVETEKQFGYSALGPLLSAQHDHWDSLWYEVDAWYHNQMMTSTLRTFDEDAADIIYVPAIFSLKFGEVMDDFIENAFSFLPHLGKKPHLVVLNHAAMLVQKVSSLLRHPHSELFTFITMSQYGNGTTFPNVLGSPYLSHVHWSQGSWHFTSEGRQFDAAKVWSSKTHFATQSFVVRHYSDRRLLHEHCLARPNLCSHADWTGPSMAVQQFEAYQSAWYNLHPQGDFVSRCSMMDSWMATSIPVVTHPEIMQAVPFQDVLNYTLLMLEIPEQSFSSPGSPNIIDILRKQFDQERALEMLEYIHDVQHVFQYMLNPQHDLVRWSHRSTLDPMDDAFTFTLKSVLRKICTDGLLPQRCQPAR